MTSILRVSLGALTIVALSAVAAQAKQETINTPAKATAAESSSASHGADPSCCAPPPKCRPRCISYKHHLTLRKTCCTCKTIKVVLQVYDPCCCCCVDVPVCLPACCCDTPCKSARGGLIARGVTTFTWNCGYKVRVVMGPQGNLVVHSYGR
ncbi:MAG: hypothetical protein RIC55_09215 [Pirellulaceae bacterium]